MDIEIIKFTPFRQQFKSPNISLVIHGNQLNRVKLNDEIQNYIRSLADQPANASKSRNKESLMNILKHRLLATVNLQINEQF